MSRQEELRRPIFTDTNSYSNDDRGIRINCQLDERTGQLRYCTKTLRPKGAACKGATLNLFHVKHKVYARIQIIQTEWMRNDRFTFERAVDLIARVTGFENIKSMLTWDSEFPTLHTSVQAKAYEEVSLLEKSHQAEIRETYMLRHRKRIENAQSSPNDPWPETPTQERTRKKMRSGSDN